MAALRDWNGRAAADFMTPRKGSAFKAFTPGRDGAPGGLLLLKSISTNTPHGSWLLPCCG